MSEPENFLVNANIATSIANAVTHVMSDQTFILSLHSHDSTPLVSVLPDGNVVIYNAESVNKAATIFWDAVYKHRPTCNCFTEQAKRFTAVKTFHS